MGVGAQDLAQGLRGHRLIGLDTCVLIYFLEGHPRFGPMAREVISHILAGRSRAVVSTVSLLEVQVGPYRRGAEELADSYFALLPEMSDLQWVPLTYTIADRAARLRAEHSFATPDAIHLATAIECGATLFVTNDLSLPEVPEVRYLVFGA